MAEMKKDQDKMGSSQNKGSGSDTASAAKISAGTSVGNVGESPMPHAQGGSQGGMGTSGGAGTSAQSSTLASHTSKPMGGAGSADAGARTQQGQSGQEGSGVAETVKQAAGQMQEKAGEAYEQVSEWASDTFGRTTDQTGRMRDRSMRSMSNARQGIQNYVAQNPVMVGLVGLAAGLLLGALLPRTRREDETFGEWADEVREQGMRYAQDMTQRGREAVEGTFSGEDERFGRHESEFGTGREGGPSGPGPGAGPRGQGADRH